MNGTSAITVTLRPGTPPAPGQACEVHVSIRNDGEPVEIDNPAALMDKPEWRVARLPDEVGTIVSNWQNFQPPDGQPARLSLASGAAWEGIVPLRLAGGDAVPGEWTAVLRLETPSGVVESAPCVLHVEGWHIVAADAGYGVSPFGHAEGDALFIQSGRRERTLYRTRFVEDDSDRQGTGAKPPIRLQPIGQEASDPLVPVRDAPFMRDPSRWLLWREQSSVYALNSSLRRVTLDLPSPPAALLKPALQREGGPVEVFALSGNRTQLQRLQFPRTPEGQAAIVETIPLPASVASGRAAFAPEGGLLAAATAGTPGEVSLLLHRGGSLRRAVASGVTLVPDSPPAVSVLEDGEVIVGALVRHDERIGVARARFGAGDVAEVTFIGSVAGSIVEGSLLVSASGTAVVLRLNDGSLLRLNDNGVLERTEFEAPPVRPLTMVPAEHGSLILVCDPREGPFMAEA